MVVRWLVVVLALVGAIPVSICTCGAIHDPFQSLFAPRSGEQEPPRGPIPGLEPSSGPTEQHDADCHAVKPRPLMSAGLQLDTVDAPAVDALATALTDPPRLELAVGHAFPDLDPPPDRPLFLIYCVRRN